MERTLTIGQLAAATGLAAKTIRYYEEIAVLPAPRRSAAGYRQYARRDVHRVLFIRRARALGFPLGRLKALAADLDGRPSRAMRPRLRQLVTEQLHALRGQIADFRVLEQQLEQVLQRLGTAPAGRDSGTWQCLESVAAAPTLTKAGSRPLARLRGGVQMNDDNLRLEAITRLPGPRNGDCDCGCGCAGLGEVLAGQEAASPRVLRSAAASARTDARERRPDRPVDSARRAPPAFSAPPCAPPTCSSWG